MFQEVLYLFSDGFMYRINIERTVNDKEALRVFFDKLFVALFYLSMKGELLLFESVH